MVEFTTFFAFLASVALLPVVGQVQAESAMEKLAKGSTQAVLAVVVIGLAFALIQIFRLYRRDMRIENERIQACMKVQQEKMEKLLADNAVAMRDHAKSSESLAVAVRELTRAVIDTRHGSR
jgi:uncharacterized membrane protein